MPAKTRGAYTASQYQLLPVVGPSAGVDLRTSPTLLRADQSRTLVNFSLTEPGCLVVRSGYQAFSSNLGTGQIQGAARVYLNTSIPTAQTTNFTVVGWSGSLYQLSDSGGWSAPVSTGWSTNAMHIVSDRDLAVVFDGVTAPRKSTNGSSWTRFGIAPSTVGPTLSSGSTGAMSSGEYEVAFTYKDRDLAFESNGSSGSTLTLSGPAVSINAVIPNSTDPQVDAIVVYARKKSAGETIRRKVSSQAQSGGANSTVLINSTAWTTALEEPDDHTTPPILSFGCVWKNRWWARSATVTNRLHFTQIFDPQAWPALFYVDIPFQKGDYIQAVVPLGNSLVILGTTRIFLITGETSLDFTVLPSIGGLDGALGPRAVTVLENGIIHAGATGVYVFDGGSDRLLSFEIDPAWRDLVGNASPTDLARLALAYHQQTKELRIAVTRLYPFGTAGEWVLDMNRTRVSGESAWTATDRTIGGYVIWDGPESQAGNQQRLLTWHSSRAQVFQESVGTSANSSNITAQYEGPGLTLGTHRARWVDVRGEYEPHDGALSMEAVVDEVSQGTQPIDVGAGRAVYDTAIYDTDVYPGSGRRQFYQMLPLSADGRTFQLKLTYVGQESFRLFSYHPGLRPETASRSFTE